MSEFRVSFCLWPKHERHLLLPLNPIRKNCPIQIHLLLPSPKRKFHRTTNNQRKQRSGTIFDRWAGRLVAIAIFQDDKSDSCEWGSENYLKRQPSSPHAPFIVEDEKKWHIDHTLRLDNHKSCKQLQLKEKGR